MKLFAFTSVILEMQSLSFSYIFIPKDVHIAYGVRRERDLLNEPNGWKFVFIFNSKSNYGFFSLLGKTYYEKV